MAKKKAKKPRTSRMFIDGIIAAQEKKTGQMFKGTKTPKVIREGIYGLRFPSLALMYLHSSTVLMWGGRVYGLSGPKGIGKTALLSELGRLSINSGGNFLLVSTEFKPSPTLSTAILGDEAAELMYYKDLPTIEEAFELIQASINLRASMPGQESLLIGLDSITGVTSGKNAEKIAANAKADNMAGALNAKMWTEYFQVLPGMMVDKPISMFFISHEKARINTNPLAPKKGAAGGVAKDYQATYFIKVSCVKKVRKDPDGGNLLKLRMDKNAMGVDSRNILVKMCWAYEDRGDREYVWFDWDDSTARLLVDHKSKVKEVMDVAVTKDGKKYSSDRLGLKSVVGTEFGRAVHGDSKLMRELIDILHISRYKSLLDEEMLNDEVIDVFQGTPNFKPGEGGAAQAISDELDGLPEPEDKQEQSDARYKSGGTDIPDVI